MQDRPRPQAMNYKSTNDARESNRIKKKKIRRFLVVSELFCNVVCFLLFCIKSRPTRGKNLFVFFTFKVFTVPMERAERFPCERTGSGLVLETTACGF